MVALDLTLARPWATHSTWQGRPEQTALGRASAEGPGPSLPEFSLRGTLQLSNTP